MPWDTPRHVANSKAVAEQSHIFSQLGVYVSIQEDIQCRYSLACRRLQSLLSAVDDTAHTQHYLKKKDKKVDEDRRVYEAYRDCIALQQQLNVAQRAIHRLHKAVGLSVSDDSPSSLQQACPDKLEILSEQLLETLLSITFSSLSIPGIPESMYTVLNPSVCEDLFHHLCVRGTKRMQSRAGLLLVRLCGKQAWWGQFLGKMLQEYFVVEQAMVFPQDR